MQNFFFVKTRTHSLYCKNNNTENHVIVVVQNLKLKLKMHATNAKLKTYLN